MPEKEDSPLWIAMQENLRLRLMLSALPAPVQDTGWEKTYVRWWFRNRAAMLRHEPHNEPAA